MATDEQAAAGRSEFATTHWSMVLAAGNRGRPDASRALAQLCETYWYPLYAYVRRRVGDVHEAQDFTQAFFERLLELRPFETVDPERGRFRAFLLTACKRFLINEWHKGRAAKRGGGRRTLSLDFESGESKLGLVAVDTVTAEQLFEQAVGGDAVGPRPQSAPRGICGQGQAAAFRSAEALSGRARRGRTAITMRPGPWASAKRRPRSRPIG